MVSPGQEFLLSLIFPWKKRNTKKTRYHTRIPEAQTQGGGYQNKIMKQSKKKKKSTLYFQNNDSKIQTHFFTLSVGVHSSAGIICASPLYRHYPGHRRNGN